MDINNKKRIYIWGTGRVEDSFEKYVQNNPRFELFGVPNAIEGYIDTYKSGTYKGKRIYDIDEIKINNAFFIVAVHDYYQIENKLKSMGLQLGRDYICISTKYRFEDLQRIKYESFNLISGNVDIETLEMSECCELYVGEKTHFGKNVCIVMSGFSK